MVAATAADVEAGAAEDATAGKVAAVISEILCGDSRYRLFNRATACALRPR